MLSVEFFARVRNSASRHSCQGLYIGEKFANLDAVRLELGLSDLFISLKWTLFISINKNTKTVSRLAREFIYP